MRAMKIDDLRVKIFLQRRRISEKKNFKVESIDEHSLILKDSIDLDEFENIEEIKIIFWVSSQWKSYKLGLLDASIDQVENYSQKIKSVHFTLSPEHKKEFVKDLSLVMN